MSYPTYQQQQPDQPTQPIYPTSPTPSYLPPPPAPPQPPAAKRPNWRIIGGAVLGTVALFALIAYAASGDLEDTLPAGEPQRPPLERAVEDCAPHEPDIRVGDGGRSVSIDSARPVDRADGAGVEAVACILGAINVPDAVVSRIDNTRALDGTQTAEWGDYNASWTYHPDAGLNMVIEQQ